MSGVCHISYCRLSVDIFSHASSLPPFLGSSLDCLGFSHCVVSCFPTLLLFDSSELRRASTCSVALPPGSFSFSKHSVAFAVGSVTVSFLFFLLVSRSQVSLCRSWLREPHRFLEFKPSI